ncbi:GrpB family protein [Candidatus Harpocratesius sp.]
MCPKSVIVVPYDPNWPEWFGKIKNYFLPALGSLTLAIEHVGSTSVPGLAAKPIIDVDIVIHRENFLKVREKLEQLGFIHEGDFGIHDREAFKPISKEIESKLPPLHLYVCPEDSEELHRHINFREYLKDHPSISARYGAVKIESAKKYPFDIDAYISAKSPIIQEIYENIKKTKE